jgi:hypothetical protein
MTEFLKVIPFEPGCVQPTLKRSIQPLRVLGALLVELELQE